MARKNKSTARKKATKRSNKKAGAKSKTKGTCFVMMPFREPFETYYDGIFEPAIIKANLDPIRPVDLFRPSGIVSDLWQMIQDAKVLLAELTTKNANVFYELGLAHAIGKPVILVCESMDDVPFDLQQLRVLLYDKNNPTWGSKLTVQITSAITETLDSPIEAVPIVFRKIVASQAPEQDALAARLDALESQMRIRSPNRWGHARIDPFSPIDPQALSEEARKILVAVSKDPHGLLIYVRTLNDTKLQTAGLDLCVNESSQSVARLGGAVRALETVGMIRQGSEGIYKLTRLGYDYAAKIEEAEA